MTELPKFPEVTATYSQLIWREKMIVELQKRLKEIDKRYVNRSSKILAENDLIYEVLKALQGSKEYTSKLAE